MTFAPDCGFPLGCSCLVKLRHAPAPEASVTCLTARMLGPSACSNPIKILTGESSRLVAQTLAFWPEDKATGPETWKSCTLSSNRTEACACIATHTNSASRVVLARTMRKRGVGYLICFCSFYSNSLVKTARLLAYYHEGKFLKGCFEAVDNMPTWQLAERRPTSRGTKSSVPAGKKATIAGAGSWLQNANSPIFTVDCPRSGTDYGAGWCPNTCRTAAAAFRKSTGFGSTCR